MICGGSQLVHREWGMGWGWAGDVQSHQKSVTRFCSCSFREKAAKAFRMKLNRMKLNTSFVEKTGARFFSSRDDWDYGLGPSGGNLREIPSDPIRLGGNFPQIPSDPIRRGGNFPQISSRWPQTIVPVISGAKKRGPVFSTNYVFNFMRKAFAAFSRKLQLNKCMTHFTRL